MHLNNPVAIYSKIQTNALGGFVKPTSTIMSSEVQTIEKKVVLKKTYTVTVEHFDDGTQRMNRRNEGFYPLELIGIAQLISMEVRDQIMGKIKPDIIKREVVVDSKDCPS